MDFGLDGRVALVTGASGDIGGAIARALAAEGATVAAGWHSAEDRVKALPATPYRMDQSDPASVRAAVARIEAELGPITVLVANAVVWPTPDPETWDTLIAALTVNVAGTLETADAVLPGMRAAGWGRLVLISSDVVEQPVPAAAAYPAAKSALETAAKVLALREARHGVLTNVVRPGFTLTERALTHPRFGREVVDRESAKTPTGRICTPEDVASTVAYLASAANGHVNGEVVSVAGGRHLAR